jgi:hypothetical protein
VKSSTSLPTFTKNLPHLLVSLEILEDRGRNFHGNVVNNISDYASVSMFFTNYGKNYYDRFYYESKYYYVTNTITKLYTNMFEIWWRKYILENSKYRRIYFF